MKYRDVYLNCGETPIKYKKSLLNQQGDISTSFQHIRKRHTNHSSEIRSRKITKGKSDTKVIAESLYKVNDTGISNYETPLSIDIEPIKDLDRRVRELESVYEVNSKKQRVVVGPFPGFLGLKSEEVDKKEKQKKLSEDLKKQIEEKKRIKNQQRLREKEEVEREEKRIERETGELLARHVYEKATEGKLFKRCKPTVNDLQGTVMEDTISPVQKDLPKFNPYPNDYIDSTEIEESSKDISENSLRSNAKLVKVEDKDDLYKTWKIRQAMVIQEKYKPEEKVIEPVMQDTLEPKRYIDPDSKVLLNSFS